ncbi:tRNA (adenosine(37)-N6)-dimethylallyltransferase MiaA [Pannus brasiliensis CCIBt3594]|uniref:tRNA dimethylallyltransferase n=1 Tax=Pannus brasiliensis CCIBt3594 TaxID=1427578 RepID=A0AAW9R156_9CHRO
MATTSPPIVIVICGATATGKSGLALQLAERFDSVILSADSRQVYRDFDIGTAKPTREERERVPHYLIDIRDPTETLTLAEYQEEAEKLIATLPDRPLFLVGGTGLYIKSIARGLKIPKVSPRPELREQLQSQGQTYLYQILRHVDPVSSEKIHPNDEVRTLRALEVFYATGKPISEQQGENPPSYPILQIGLECSAESLQKRIERRTRSMVEMGLVEEVKGLGEKYGYNLPLLDTLGYAEMKRYLFGEISLEEAIDLTVLHTRQFAKRQRTWFRAYPEIRWFPVDGEDSLDRICREIDDFLCNIPPSAVR